MPEGYEFVDRVEEIRRITSLIDTLNRNPKEYLPKCIVNLHGPPGIGKTALLQEIRRRLDKQSSTALLVDLRSSAAQDSLAQEKLAFLENAESQLRDAEPSLDLKVLSEAIARAKEIGDDRAFNDALEALREALRQCSQQRTLVLLIDSCEHASEALFAWLERFLLLDLIQSDRSSRLVGVFASQIILRWRQYSVRRRVDTFRLEPLSLEATQEQIGDRDLGGVVYALTSGHPLANQEAHVYLASAPEENRKSWLEQHRSDLMKALLERLRQHISDSMLRLESQQPQARLDEKNWSVLQVLSVLREFDVRSMREILKAHDSDRYQNLSEFDSLITIRELLRTRLVEWNADLHAYQIAPEIRRIFAQALALNQPEAYAKLRDIAAKYYRNQIEAAPGNRHVYRHVYVVEYLFQRLSHPATTQQDVSAVLEELRSFLKRHYSDHEDLKALEQFLSDSEQGKELSTILERLSYPPDAFVKEVKNFNLSDASS